ncbi:ImmA/IrrE family metallo-endopeptidase, partial [bacterium]|nr:ImmA/IrrE family metallo-endopeptidase [bacterium]
MDDCRIAAPLGVSQSTIAYIENGRLTPSDELLEAIAGQTGFPSAFFQQETGSDFPLGSLLLFRARASVTASDQSFAHRYAQVVYELAGKLARRVTTIHLRLPQINDDIPESAASMTRDALGLSPDTPIRDLIHTIEKSGVFVLALPFSLERIDAFSLWAGSHSETPVIVVLSDAPGDRLRFNVAHEIGHLVMHRSMKGDVQGVEKEADRFAGALLLPEPAMREELFAPITLTSIAALKRRWRVSMQALIMRAFDLGIITDRQ